MSFETKKPNIVGDTSFTERLFELAEREDKPETKLKEKSTYLDRQMEQVEFNGKKVWKITTYERIE